MLLHVYRQTLPNINKTPSQSANEDLTLPEGANGRLYGISVVQSECPPGRLTRLLTTVLQAYTGYKSIVFINRVLLLESGWTVDTVTTRHKASTSMYSLTFCVRVMSPERHLWKPAVQAAAVMLRTPPSPASHRPAARAHPAERSHYVVISWDGRKLVTRVRVMLP